MKFKPVDFFIAMFVVFLLAAAYIVDTAHQAGVPMTTEQLTDVIFLIFAAVVCAAFVIQQEIERG